MIADKNRTGKSHRTTSGFKLNDSTTIKKVDSTNEYMMIEEVMDAKKQEARDLSVHKDIFDFYDEEIDFSILHSHGVYEKTLAFYEKHDYSNICKMIVKSKSDKVISPDTKIFKNLVVEEGFESDITEIPFDREALKNAYKTMSIYGKSLVITSIKDGQIAFESVEPFRYFEKEGTFTTISIKNVRYNGVTKTVEYKETTFFEDQGKIIERDIELSKKDGRNNYVVYNEEEIKVDFVVFELINSIDKVSDIFQISQELIKLDLIETIKTNELKSTQFSIHADKNYFADGKFQMSGAYRIYTNDSFAEQGEPLFKEFNPQIRAQEYIEVTNNYLQHICVIMGMSARAMGFSSFDSRVASIAEMDDAQTGETINSSKNNVSLQVNKAIKKLLGDDSYTLDLSEYSSTTFLQRADLFSKFNLKMSSKKLVNFLYSTDTEEERMNELVRLKSENGIMMTKDEMDIAKNLGYEFVEEGV